MGQVRSDMSRIRAAVDAYMASMAPPEGITQETKQELHDRETQKVDQRFQQEAEVDVPGHGGDIMKLFL